MTGLSPASRALDIIADRKAWLIAAFLAFDAPAVADRIGSLGASPALLAFAGLYALLLACLLAAAWIPRSAARIAVGALFAVSAMVVYAYNWTTFSPFDYNAFRTMLASRADAGDALAQHGGTLARAALAALVLFIAIALPPRRKVLPGALSAGLPGAAIVLLAAMLYLRGGEGNRALPAPFAPLAFSAIHTGLALSADNGPRRAVSMAPTGAPAAKDIVLLVDESVAGNYLDINHPRGVRSGLAQERAGFGIANFGIAASVSNCSVGSNKTLRFGGTRDNFRAVGRREPSIWAYAKGAGMRTVYLDGQRRHGQLQNLATPAERAEIDHFVQLGEMPVIERDQHLARLLAERIGNDTAEFIYVNKVGAHFPVADKFPLDRARYFPLPERGLTTRIIDMGPVHGSHRGTPEEWRLYRNAYRNTLEWNVGQFFDTLLGAIDPDRVVILYTSDHGQDLHERGNPGKGTHCVNDPLPEEGAVPLVAIDSAASPSLDWQAHLAANRDGMSHFRIFPTMLELMGYPAAEVAAIHGPSLVSPEPDPVSFTINYFAALGREPTWRGIDRDELAAPPGDYDVQMALGAR